MTGFAMVAYPDHGWHGRCCVPEGLWRKTADFAQALTEYDPGDGSKPAL